MFSRRNRHGFAIRRRWEFICIARSGGNAGFLIMIDDTETILSGGPRELTLDELDAVSGGDFWGVVFRVLDAVGGTVLKVVPALNL